MSISLINAKPMLTKEIKNDILNKLKELQVNPDLNLFKVEILSYKIDVSKLDRKKVLRDIKVWEDLAKLSINLLKDYEYFRQFTFNGRFDNKEYKNRLEILGYANENGKWRSVTAPNIKDVLTNVFMYYLYKYTLSVMNSSFSKLQPNLELRNKELCDKNKEMKEVVHLENLNKFKNQNETRLERTSQKITCDDSSCVMPSIKLYKSTSQDLKHSSNTSIDKWLCSKCTFKNRWENKFCEICFNNVDQSTEDCVTELLGETKGTWDCNYCKCENFVDRYICKKCHKDALFVKKWVCKKCQFFNDMLAEYCEVCMVNNEYLANCDKCKVAKVNVLESTVCNFCEHIISETEEKMGYIKGRSYCNNRWCGAINAKNCNYCPNCKLKNGSLSDVLNKMDVYNGQKYVKKWQCTYCGRYNDSIKCIKCRNMCLSKFYKLCACNWVNPSKSDRCDKCFKKL